ncbi:VOC family protein [Bacillus shivajii]|uniref:VOC family protein n=1 Tax=Bacillus shivajii TaxID=1983719 RepID=UPI001CFB7CD3|nr:VOC family protein [Bacillus shivajii]UCZ53984.1 VOC family protein [Bacillus shivajii]
MQFTHTRLLVKDYETCFKFYKDTLGFEVDWGDENTNYAQFQTGGHLLAIFGRKMMADAVGKSDRPLEAQQMDRIVLIFRVDNVDESAYSLKKNGVSLDLEPVDRPDWGIRVAHFRDPDGNLIEINEPIPYTG